MIRSICDVCGFSCAEGQVRSIMRGKTRLYVCGDCWDEPARRTETLTSAKFVKSLPAAPYDTTKMPFDPTDDIMFRPDRYGPKYH
jgi:ribosome-binding protein aMBF1 (putative translation factor)